MTVRAFALCHALQCPPPLSYCPHCFGIHRRESSPLYFPPSAPIHILASCSAAVPSSSTTTVIYCTPQSPHRPLLPPLTSPLYCQFSPPPPPAPPPAPSSPLPSPLHCLFGSSLIFSSVLPLPLLLPWSPTSQN